MSRKYEFVIQEETITIGGKTETVSVEKHVDEAIKNPERKIYTIDGEPALLVFPRGAINHARTKPSVVADRTIERKGAVAPERESHKLAKHAIKSGDRIAIPNGDVFVIKDIEREKKIGSIVVDLLATDDKGRKLIIEFYLTNMKEGKSAIEYTQTCREEGIQGIEVEISFIQENKLAANKDEAIKQIRKKFRNQRTKTRIIFEYGQKDDEPNKWTDKPDHYLSFAKQEHVWRKEVNELERKIARNKDRIRTIQASAARGEREFAQASEREIHSAVDCQKVQRELLSIESKIERKEKAIESNKRGIQSNNFNIEYYGKACERIKREIHDDDADPF